MYVLVFDYADGSGSYEYGRFNFLETAFGTPRLFGMNWTYNGHGMWTSWLTIFEEPGKAGHWRIYWD